MGGSAWSDDYYKDKAKARLAASVPTFAFDHYAKAGLAAYDRDVNAGKIDLDPRVRVAVATKTASPKLDPKGVLFRESRDSAVHPEAVPVAVLMDVTGSMQQVPTLIQAKLPQLMGLLIRKGYLEHPAILVGAIGDATCDRIPLQIGQFESGIEIEDCLTSLYLEGGGGGHITESYELGLYFLARHTVTDHWEKRGERGYLFVIGDEIPYDRVNPDQVKGFIGDPLGEALATADVVAELRKWWEMFFILPNLTSHWQDKAVLGPWRKLLPQRVIELDDPGAICECIAGQIGLFERGLDAARVTDDLVDAGTDRTAAMAVGRALVPAGAGSGSAKGSVQKVPSSGAASGLAKF
jgi:hypothetical protein